MDLNQTRASAEKKNSSSRLQAEEIVSKRKREKETSKNQLSSAHRKRIGLATRRDGSTSQPTSQHDEMI
jgi:hypothetical protein